jgi:hypothetical protein
LPLLRLFDRPDSLKQQCESCLEFCFPWPPNFFGFVDEMPGMPEEFPAGHGVTRKHARQSVAKGLIGGA